MFFYMESADIFVRKVSSQNKKPLYRFLYPTSRSAQNLWNFHTDTRILYSEYVKLIVKHAKKSLIRKIIRIYRRSRIDGLYTKNFIYIVF